MSTPTIKATASDRELSAAVAEHVAKCEMAVDWYGRKCCVVGKAYDGKANLIHDPLPYATSFDTIWPLLSRYQWLINGVGISGDLYPSYGGYASAIVRVYLLDGREFEAFAQGPTSPARAACLALLKAHGVEVVD